MNIYKNKYTRTDEVVQASYDLCTSSLDLCNRSLDLVFFAFVVLYLSHDPFNSSKDVFHLSHDPFTASHVLYNSSHEECTSSFVLYNSSHDACTASCDAFTRSCVLLQRKGSKPNFQREFIVLCYETRAGVS